MSDIQPEVGRCLHYYPSSGDAVTVMSNKQPFAVRIVFVHGIRSVNIAGYDHIGRLFNREFVTLIQPDDDASNDHEAWAGNCMWMPYQANQAADPIPPA